jgi:hypothetical protein
MVTGRDSAAAQNKTKTANPPGYDNPSWNTVPHHSRAELSRWGREDLNQQLS